MLFSYRLYVCYNNIFIICIKKINKYKYNKKCTQIKFIFLNLTDRLKIVTKYLPLTYIKTNSFNVVEFI